jgi:O-acetyl-ADP-ribose deacetylase (regulator of RNase III)
MEFKIVQKDILTVSKDFVIAHNIDSGETALGAGVALALCNKYTNLRDECKKFARDNEHKVGITYRCLCDERIVYNMYTKPHVWYNANKGMSMNEYLLNQRNCLISLKNQMLEHNENKLAIPKIACGLDRCNWVDIEQIIKEVFENTKIEIIVCVL